MQAGMQDDGELDSDLFAPPTDSRFERTEKFCSVAVERELRRMQGRHSHGNLTDSEESQLRFLNELDKSAGPAVDGVRLLTVTYGKRRAIGRLTASYPALQSCPSALRPRIAGRFYHDADIVNCHPVLKLQVAEKMGVETPKLREYVSDRSEMLQRIADHYGVTPQKAKYAVLRVLNLGGIEKWIKDSECIRGQYECQLDLRELQEEARVVMDSFFEMDQFKAHVAEMTKDMETSTAAKVRAATERYQAAAANAKVDAKQALDEAKRKATPIAIQRSVFAGCCFELEDSVLEVVDCHLQEKGWTVATLIYDGLLVEVRPGADLEAVLREAETAVKQKLDYKIALMEKPLFTKPMGGCAQEDQPPLEEPPGEQAQEDQAMSEEPQA